MKIFWLVLAVVSAVLAIKNMYDTEIEAARFCILEALLLLILGRLW